MLVLLFVPDLAHFAFWQADSGATLQAVLTTTAAVCAALLAALRHRYWPVFGVLVSLILVYRTTWPFVWFCLKVGPLRYPAIVLAEGASRDSAAGTSLIWALLIYPAMSVVLLAMAFLGWRRLRLGSHSSVHERR